MSCRRLFVYGTLMARATQAFGAVQRQQLAREGRWLGEAWVIGHLYDFGDYPGLVVANRGFEFVYGEIFELSRPDDTLRWIDQYEGVRHGCGVADEYARRQMTATFDSGEACEVWVYIYCQPVPASGHVFGGRWGAC